MRAATFIIYEYALNSAFKCKLLLNLSNKFENCNCLPTRFVKLACPYHQLKYVDVFNFLTDNEDIRVLKNVGYY